LRKWPALRAPARELVAAQGMIVTSLPPGTGSAQS